WLTADPETIWRRIEADAATAARRPNLTAAGGLAEVEELLRAREPFYRECAHWVVETAGRTPEEVAEHVRALGELSWLMLLAVGLIWVSLLGASPGSFLNVCISRIPYEKSIVWPSSRCGNCLKAIRWYDNLPLLSYWLRRGRCRHCGARFSARYFLMELFS